MSAMAKSNKHRQAFCAEDIFTKQPRATPTWQSRLAAGLALISRDCVHGMRVYVRATYAMCVSITETSKNRMYNRNTECENAHIYVTYADMACQHHFPYCIIWAREYCSLISRDLKEMNHNYFGLLTHMNIRLLTRCQNVVHTLLS